VATETYEDVGRRSAVSGFIVSESRRDHEFDPALESLAGVVD
jgi:hypothetical protein